MRWDNPGECSPCPLSVVGKSWVTVGTPIPDATTSPVFGNWLLQVSLRGPPLTSLQSSKVAGIVHHPCLKSATKRALGRMLSRHAKHAVDL